MPKKLKNRHRGRIVSNNSVTNLYSATNSTSSRPRAARTQQQERPRRSVTRRCSLSTRVRRRVMVASESVRFRILLTLTESRCVVSTWLVSECWASTRHLCMQFTLCLLCFVFMIDFVFFFFFSSVQMLRLWLRRNLTQRHVVSTQNPFLFFSTSIILSYLFSFKSD
jgi:hypothetical protein